MLHHSPGFAPLGEALNLNRPYPLAGNRCGRIFHTRFMMMFHDF